MTRPSSEPESVSAPSQTNSSQQRSKTEDSEEKRQRKKLVKEVRVSAGSQAAPVVYGQRTSLSSPGVSPWHRAARHLQPTISRVQREARMRKKSTKEHYKETASSVNLDPMHGQRRIAA